MLRRSDRIVMIYKTPDTFLFEKGAADQASMAPTHVHQVLSWRLWINSSGPVLEVHRKSWDSKSIYRIYKPRIPP